MAEVNVRVSDSGRLFPDAVVIKVDEQEIIAGQDGISPVVTVTEIGTAEAVSSHGYEVDVSDAAGVHTYSVYDGASAYAQAVAGGYSGTEEEFAADLIGFNTRAAEATAGATAAAAYADAASDSATAAATSESNAADSATAAASSASSAAGSATAAGNAEEAAQAAQTGAEEAQRKAEDAQEAAEAALAEFTTPTASAVTLAAGSQATASYNNGNFAFGIPKGNKGDTGTTFTPAVSEQGVISWSNDGGKPNPTPVDLAAEVEGVFVVNVSGTTPSIVGAANTRYICGEVSTISITPPQSGIIDVVFTSGSTAALLTLPNTVLMPGWFEVEADMVYEINIADGIYGSVMAWAVT